jgi:transposase
MVKRRKSVMKQKRYDEEFKRNAVHMLLVGGRPLKVLAGELGVSDTALRGWRDQYLKDTDRHPGGEGMPTPREMAEEIRTLKKELVHVTWQRDILKKAASILSEKSPGGMP